VHLEHQRILVRRRYVAVGQDGPVWSDMSADRCRRSADAASIAHSGKVAALFQSVRFRPLIRPPRFTICWGTGVVETSLRVTVSGSDRLNSIDG